MTDRCNNLDCSVSTGMHDGLTFGSGQLDVNGYWEFPCSQCARSHEEKYQQHIPCWPFGKEKTHFWSRLTQSTLLLSPFNYRRVITNCNNCLAVRIDFELDGTTHIINPPKGCTDEQR